MNRLQNLTLPELMEESKNIVQKVNQEQDENEMQLYNKIGGQNSVIKEKT
jgi:hypothetical protein